jgi:hypothetical protein
MRARHDSEWPPAHPQRLSAQLRVQLGLADTLTVPAVTAPRPTSVTVVHRPLSRAARPTRVDRPRSRIPAGGLSDCDLWVPLPRYGVGPTLSHRPRRDTRIMLASWAICLAAGAAAAVAALVVF